MSNPIRSIRIEVSGWPNDELFDTEDPHYQWDIFVDGEEYAGGTGPGDAIMHAYYAIECLNTAQYDEDAYFPWVAPEPSDAGDS